MFVVAGTHFYFPLSKRRDGQSVFITLVAKSGGTRRPVIGCCLGVHGPPKERVHIMTNESEVYLYYTFGGLYK